MTAGLLIDRIGRLFTAGPRGVLADAAVVVTDATIAWIGAAGAAPPADIDVDERVDCAGGLVTPRPDRRSHASRVRRLPAGRDRGPLRRRTVRRI